MQNITLDRWYVLTSTHIELHAFVDASKIAYGIACYIRFKVNNQPKWSFLILKPKLASVKTKYQNQFHNLNYKPL